MRFLSDILYIISMGKGNEGAPDLLQRCVVVIEIDTLEYQQTEKIETELKDVDRIRAYRCTQLCPGCPSGASH